MITSLRAELPSGINGNNVTWTRLGLSITRKRAHSVASQPFWQLRTPLDVRGSKAGLEPLSPT